MPATSPPGSGRRRSTAERRDRSGAIPSRSARFRRVEFAKFRRPRFRTLAVGAANRCTNFARNSQPPIRFLCASRPECKSIAILDQLENPRQSNVSHVALALNLGTFPSRPRRNAGNHVLSSLRLTLFINWRIFSMLWDMVVRGWENFLARRSGPLNLRFFVQPTVAGLLALRAGIQDARLGRQGYLWPCSPTRSGASSCCMRVARSQNPFPRRYRVRLRLSSHHPAVRLPAGALVYSDLDSARPVRFAEGSVQSPSTFATARRR
jgi:hypothetical protein